MGIPREESARSGGYRVAMRPMEHHAERQPEDSNTEGSTTFQEAAIKGAAEVFQRCGCLAKAKREGPPGRKSTNQQGMG